MSTDKYRLDQRQKRSHILCGCVLENYILHPSGVHVAARHNNTVDTKKDQVKADNEACGKQGNDWPDDHQTAKNDSHNVQNLSLIHI